jgi:dimethylglycine dehydrogenase
MPPDLDRVEHIIMAAMERIPALQTGGVKSVINGPITFSPDANPLIGPAHGVQDAWLLTGSSMGVMEGGGAGWFLAHWMTHGAPPMDALSVDSRRFGAWADRDYRVAKAVECFGLQFGVHYPHEERPAGRGLRLSPLHDLMIERGAVMGAAHGWERPNWFSATPGVVADETFRRANWFGPVAAEVESASTRVAMADLSVFSKFDVTGPDVAPFLEALGANRAPGPGRIGLTHALTPAGGVLSEFTVTMLGAGHAYLTSAAAAEEIDLDLLRARAMGFNVRVENITEDIAVIGVMGPKAADVLPEVADMPWLTARETTVAGVPVRALRVSYIGEAGWELHVAAKNAVRLFKVLEQIAQPFAPCFYGAYAANSMRLEKGYRGWGSDLTSERSPMEAGLASFVRPELRRALARDTPWDMVLLGIDAGEVDPFYAHTLWQSGRPVGIVTSGAYGHRTGEVLALAYLREVTARDNLTVSILGMHRAAVILPEPPFDPRNMRLKAGGFS